MSMQFGRWNFDGQAPAPDLIDKVNRTLAPYAPDTHEKHANGGVIILYLGFHTTKESHHEVQPHVFPCGTSITWDGRLDNRSELIGELSGAIKSTSPIATSTQEFADVQIVAAAYQRWQAGCLERLIGNWALSIWNPRERSLLLARDPIGTNHLYYSIEKEYVSWSTILDPLVLFAERTFEICEEYVAHWLTTTSPPAHVTPYASIYAVPPSSSVLLQLGRHGVKQILRRYWDFDPRKKIRYRTNAEYEEHFRDVLSTAIRRNLRSDRPVLGELSGGIDSSSIICIADMIMASGYGECPRLDTMSWCDRSEPNWGEFPNVTRVEDQRGRRGYHIDATSLRKDGFADLFESDFTSDRLSVTPTPNGGLTELGKLTADYMRSGGYRVTLSGIGGEIMGDGVPTPVPELQDLLRNVRLLTLLRQLNAWAARLKKPRLTLLRQAVRGFYPRTRVAGTNGVPVWLRRGFVHRNQASLRGNLFGVNLFGPLPSFQHRLQTLDDSRRLMEASTVQREMLRELRYPYFDRDLLEFMYAIPQEQIVGVGQRRFLMRRALVGIVPNEILNRKKRQNSPDDIRESALRQSLKHAELGQHMISSWLGIIEGAQFLEAWRSALNDEIPLSNFRCTLTLESWLRHLELHGVVMNSASVSGGNYSVSSWGHPQLRRPSGHRVQLASSWKSNAANERR
jgi:asparagine synthase (glutamine-hydrolysing)